MSEYHKIETLYERDEKTFKVTGVIRNRTYSLLKTWHWTEKIDGTNIRAIWNHETGKLQFGGKTDNAQIHADLFRYLYETLPVENVRGVFPDVCAVIYGEGYGAGIQKGGDYSATKKFIIFDVLVDGKWWLSWENVCDIAAKLHLETVPDFGEMPLEQASELVRAGFPSKLNGGKMKAEGLVGRPLETLFDKKGARLIVKLKTKDF
jgi:RNA ligase